MKFIFGIILLWPSVIIIVKKREGQRKILTDTIFVLITDKIKYFTCIATSGHYCGQCIVLFFKPTTCPGDSMSIVSSSQLRAVSYSQTFGFRVSTCNWVLVKGGLISKCIFILEFGFIPKNEIHHYPQLFNLR